jgi:hypothetical protein
VALGTAPLAGRSELAGLDAHYAAKAGMTLLHVVPSLLFVLLVPLQFVSSWRGRYPILHRWTGRMLMGLGAVIGISALWLSAHPVGGLAEGTATILFGCFFLFSLGKAWWHIRNGRVELHREWVMRMVATALGVATTRPIMAVFCNQPANQSYATAILRAGNVARVNFNLSCLRGLDQLLPKSS